MSSKSKLSKKEARHMLSVVENQYKVIEDYCKSRNLIVSRWVMSACFKEISGSLGLLSKPSGSIEK